MQIGCESGGWLYDRCASQTQLRQSLTSFLCSHCSHADVASTNIGSMLDRVQVFFRFVGVCSFSNRSFPLFCTESGNNELRHQRAISKKRKKPRVISICYRRDSTLLHTCIFYWYYFYYDTLGIDERVCLRFIML